MSFRSANRAAKKIKEEISKHGEPCALFVLPLGEPLLCAISGDAFYHTIRQHQSYWVGTYDVNTPQVYIADDIQEATG